MLLTVVLLLFKLENKKELQEEFNRSQWSALRGFNWQHSKPYRKPQPTDLFCHAVSFCQIQYVNKLKSTLPCKYWGSIYSHMNFQWSKGL